MKRPSRQTVLNVAIGTILTLLLVLTLTPSRSAMIDSQSLCLICGERGLADAILNVFLFVPLGLALGARVTSRPRAYALAVAVSACIEVAQVFIPGRDSSIADVVFNGLGAMLGVGLARSWRLWIRPSPRAARRLAWTAAAGAIAAFIVTDMMLRPAFPVMQYDAAWTPNLRHMQHYQGSVMQAAVGETVTPPGFLADSDRVRVQLLAGEPFRVLVVAGAPPVGAAPVVAINGFQTEIVSLVVDRFDLIFRHRTQSAAFQLDRPELRYEGALAGARPGKVLRIGAERRGEEYCLSVDDSRRCGLGFTLGEGWALLLWSSSMPVRLTVLLSLLWLAMISLPAALWAPGVRQALVSAAAIGAGPVSDPPL